MYKIFIQMVDFHIVNKRVNVEKQEDKEFKEQKELEVEEVHQDLRDRLAKKDRL